MEVLPAFARPIMRTRNLIFGSGRSDVAGTEFVFPMLVGCGVQESMIGLIRVDDHMRPSHLPFLAEVMPLITEHRNLLPLALTSSFLALQITPHARALTTVPSPLECHIYLQEYSTLRTISVVGLRPPTSLPGGKSSIPRIRFTNDTRQTLNPEKNDWSVHP